MGSPDRIKSPVKSRTLKKNYSGAQTNLMSSNKVNYLLNKSSIMKSPKKEPKTAERRNRLRGSAQGKDL